MKKVLEQMKQNNWYIGIFEDKNSEKNVKFASSGCNMSDRWWVETYKLDQNGQIWGVYETSKGLRRTLNGFVQVGI